MKTNKLYILQGLPASGKSTFANNFAMALGEKTGIIIISSDEIRFKAIPKGMYHESEVGDQGYSILVNEFVWSRVRNKIFDNLEIGLNVIVDATNLQRRWWKQYLTIGYVFNVDIVGVEINLSVDQCIERDKNRDRSVGEDIIRKMEASREYLSKFPEDFDQFIKVNYP